MTEPWNQTDVDSAYLAGVIDGEGCFIVNKKCRPSLVVVMAFKGKPVLDHLASLWGGSVRLQRAETDRWSATFRWNIPIATLKAIIHCVAPRLRVKARQAALVRRMLLSPNRNQQPMRASAIRMLMSRLNATGRHRFKDIEVETRKRYRPAMIDAAESAYTAGLIDAEGTLHITLDYKAYMAVSMAVRSRDVLFGLCATWGGTMAHRAGGQPHWSGQYRWLVQARQLCRMLTSVGPSLRLKKHQCLLIQHLYDVKDQFPKYGVRRTDLEPMRLAVRALNQRGPSWSPVVSVSTSDHGETFIAAACVLPERSKSVSGKRVIDAGEINQCALEGAVKVIAVGQIKKGAMADRALAQFAKRANLARSL